MRFALYLNSAEADELVEKKASGYDLMSFVRRGSDKFGNTSGIRAKTSILWFSTDRPNRDVQVSPYVP